MTALLPSLALALLAQAGTPQQPSTVSPPRPMRSPGQTPVAPGPTGVPAQPAPAQPPPTPPVQGPVQSPGRKPNPTMPPAGEGTTSATSPNCSEVRRKARFNIYFDKVDIEKLVQTVSDATCRTFILGDNVRGKISIIGPDNGKVDVGADEFYAAFLAALDANQLAVVPMGRFSKIVEKAKAKQSNIPVVGPDEPYTTNEQMITRMFKIRYADLEPLRGVLQQLVSQNGDTIPFQPDTLIVNDIGSNMHRLERIIEQLDSRSSSDEMRVIQIRYASAPDLATTIQKLFDAKANRPGARPGLTVTPAPGPIPGAPIHPGAPVQPGAQPGAVSGRPGDGHHPHRRRAHQQAGRRGHPGGQRTHRRPAPGDRRADQRRGTDQRLRPAERQRRGHRRHAPVAGAGHRQPAAGGRRQPASEHPRRATAAAATRRGPGGVTAAELFQGEVKISPDKATNSLVVVASQSDFRNLVRVIEKLDLPARQVFVEAVIMEVDLDRQSNFGISLHQGFTVNTSQGQAVGVVGTKYASNGVPPSFSLTNLASYGGFLAGLQGPTIPAFDKLGLSIPSFGVVLHALQSSSDVNVLSTPHLLTSDNEEAEITVGQNVPFQAGFAPQLPTATGGTVRRDVDRPGRLAARRHRRLLRADQPAERRAEAEHQAADQRERLRPDGHQREHRGDRLHRPGARPDHRQAHRQDHRGGQGPGDGGDRRHHAGARPSSSVSKVPVLGDIPLLGYLFRETSKHKVKTNLLLFLTPYIIRDASDFRRIFEKKMAERQRFVEEFYGQVPGYDVPIDFGRKPGPLGKVNQLVMREELKVENGGPGPPRGEHLSGPPGSRAAGSRRPGSPGSRSPPARRRQVPSARRDDPSGIDGSRPAGSRAGGARADRAGAVGPGTGSGLPRGPDGRPTCTGPDPAGHASHPVPTSHATLLRAPPGPAGVLTLRPKPSCVNPSRSTPLPLPPAPLWSAVRSGRSSAPPPA